ncbi:uncharacterized protein LOC132757974 [Ruditapes philippinarum]|uniref:uncharacterized protein LOC132757974 n=1 Tax=Ruditapes philippinarum TaxID=129788 RepID=UPI00295BC49B|nr:uncharacterized protein LOC132757974 [Ruditapes philippinarum]
MPNNRKVAEQRLLLLGKRLKGDANFQEQYCEFMDKVIKSDYARKVPSKKLTQNDGRVWYLPHHGVIHPKKNKLRVVFDCAARFQGRSLNDELLQGPNLTNTLIGTLIRFREEKIAIMGDIDSMFYQVRVPECDASLLRFLWWEEGDTNKRVIEYQMMVHLFGAKSSPSCANYALKRTAQDFSGKIDSDIVDTVMKNFYVDDCLKSVDNVDHAKSVVKDLQTVLSKGGFHIAKWLSNSREVIYSVPAIDRAKEFQDLDLDQDVLPIDRALGVQWNVELDQFCFEVNLKERPLTRRGMLSMISSVYDPLGFLAPFMLQAKNILKDMCRLGLGWDDPVPEKVVERWCLWLKDVEKLSDFNVTRCLKPSHFKEIKTASLHHFSDASETGYGIVTYLRMVDSKDRMHCSFVIGKSRVSPLKQVTIPRLELTAATVAVRTDKMLKSEIDFQLNDSVFWTDSMSVIRYIRNTSSRFRTFVANRLSVIHEGSNPDQWHYVSTKLNPADVASRGIPVDDLLKHWINAPSFLSQPELPVSPTQIPDSVPDDDPEVKKINMQKSTDSVTREVVNDPIHKLISHYSSWIKLKRAVAWIMKVRERLLHSIQYKRNVVVDHPHPVDHKFLTVQDLEKAEFTVLSYIQRNAFSREIASLSSGQSKLKRDSSIRNLDPVLDNGILRVGGRLNESAMPTEMKNPFILPKNCQVSTLILRQIHQDFNHTGRNQMLSILRERYWLINAPSAIRKLISSCVVCRRQRVKFGEQKMSSLPKDRVTPDDPPFTFVGVDYFGPFEVKQGRSYVKRYGVIFTCLTSRAIHLEVAASLDTDSYINALRRFISRRGQVTKIRSDNGSNFIGANRELKKAISEWNKHQIQSAMLQKNVDWQFNPPAGSHHGGVWERMIRTVRQTLHSVVKEQTLNDEALHTLFCEVESIINDRPITLNPDSHDDLEALTPNHLLLMKRKPNLPPGIFVKTDSYTRRRWKQVQYMADLFWRRWTREYLPLLQERQKWFDTKRNMSIGDIVLVVDSNAPRNSWLLGKVTDTIPDKLGYVRQVKLKTSFNNSLVRPVDKLCLLLESLN